mgnify:CR=1 FL=1
MSAHTKNGSELRVGDIIGVWWSPRRDTITSLRPYTGPLAKHFAHGAQLATFAINMGGMTIDNGERYDVLGSIASVEAKR